MKKLRSSRRAAWLASSVAMVFVVGVGGAFAAFPDTNVDSYTGCLNTSGSASGQVTKIAVGTNPLKGCGANQRIVHLSGGDVTNVIAGDGLSGGGSNGAVTLDLDEGYSLPQDCDRDQVTKSDGSNAWTCADDDDTVGIEVWRTFDSRTELEAGGDFRTVARLLLPTGTYLVHATGTAADDVATDDEMKVHCVFTDNEGNFVSGSAIAENTDGSFHASVIALQSVVVVPEEGFVSFECRSASLTSGETDQLESTEMTATTIATLHSQP